MIIDTIGVLMGITGAVRFRARYTDDGFDNPLTEGDTEIPNDAQAECPECKFSGAFNQFKTE